MASVDSPPADGRARELAALRDRVAALAPRAREALPFGIAALDGSLACGGLVREALHEVSCASVSLADDAAATLFVAGVAGRLAREVEAPAVWATSRFDLYAPGLEQAGLPAARVLHVEARDDDEVLAVMEDAVRDGAPAVVVGEVRRASMVATRRLQLASADRAVPVLLYRRWRRMGFDPLAEPSAAESRWRVGCSPSIAPAAGLARARWLVELVRQRGGGPFSLVLEACDHEGRLAVPAAAADRAAPAAGAVRRRAA